MSNIFTERDADLVLSTGALQLQYWYNKPVPGKESAPCLYALKVVNVSGDTLRDIDITYRITEESSGQSRVRYCDAAGNILANQVQKEHADELAAGAHQFFQGKYYRLVLEGGTGQEAVITHGFDVSYEQGSTTVTRYLGAPPKGYFFLVSQLNQFVIDIEGKSTADGARLISYPRKDAGTENQLWRFEAGQDGYFFIVSKLNNHVIDIANSSTAPVTPLISWPRNTPVSSNQQWQLEPGPDGYYRIVSKLNGYVIDITGSNTEPVTPLISYPKNGAVGTSNQLWRLVPASV